MRVTRVFARLSWILIVGELTGLFAAGCSTPRGEILVSQPEVFTRERLVNRRLSEQQWLEGQLQTNTPTSQSLQGYQDVRIFSGLYNKAAATFDPLAVQTAAEQAAVNLQNLKNQKRSLRDQNEIKALQDQLTKLKLEQQINAIHASRATASPSATSTTSTPSTGSSGKTGTTTSTTTSTTTTPPGAPTPTSSGIFVNPPTLPSPGDIVATQAKITSIELLRDQLAWRNAVQAALREQELDDAHDLVGLALYTLKLDLSIITYERKPNRYADWIRSILGEPAENDRYARVTLGPAPITIPGCSVLREQYEGWLWHLRAAVHAEAVSVEQRLEVGQLTDEEKIRIASARAVWNASKETGEGADSTPLTTKESGTPAPPEDPRLDEKREVERWLAAKYQVALQKLVVVDGDGGRSLEIKIDKRTYFVPDITRKGALEAAYRNHEDVCAGDVGAERVPHLREMKNTMAEITGTVGEDEPKAATVFVADPKEEAQNISAVAATEQLRNIVLSLQAMLPQYGVSGSNYAEYLKRSQQRLQGILRRPLVVAFSDGGTRRFGWILGPRFEVDSRGEARFNHTTVQHSVQVSIVVPGWVRELYIPYETCWLERDGTCVDLRTGKLKIELPLDEVAITTRLLAATGTRRTPVIIRVRDSNNQPKLIRLQAGQPGDVLLHGDNLWRNPRVFIGGQKADAVEVLSDMRGLNVHFNNVAIPPAKAKESPLVDLSVVTSEGMVRLSDAVQIVPASLSAEKLLVSGESARVVNALTDKAHAGTYPLRVSAPADAVPDSFARLVLSVRPLLPTEDPVKTTRPFVQIPSEIEMVKQDKKMIFQTIAQVDPLAWGPLPPGAFPGDGRLMQVEMKTAATPGSPITSLKTVDGKPMLFALFPSEQSAGGVLVLDGASPASPGAGSGALQRTRFDSQRFAFDNALTVKFGDDTVFSVAYPGLNKALLSNILLRITEVNEKGDPLVSATVPLAYPQYGLRSQTATTPTTLSISALPPAPDKPDRPSAATLWLASRLADSKDHVFRLSIVLSPDLETPIYPGFRLRLK